MSASLKQSALRAVVSVHADVMFAERTSKSLIIAFLVGCLLGFVLFVFPTEVVASSPSGADGSTDVAALMSVGATVPSGLGGVLCLILNRGVRAGGVLVVWSGPSPGYPRVWLCLGWGSVCLCCVWGTECVGPFASISCEEVRLSQKVLTLKLGLFVMFSPST